MELRCMRMVACTMNALHLLKDMLCIAKLQGEDTVVEGLFDHAKFAFMSKDKCDIYLFHTNVGQHMSRASLACYNY